MTFLDQFKAHFNALKAPEHRLAWVIAIAADTLQIAAFPLFAEGAVSPADSLLDMMVVVLLTLLLVWHGGFLPTLAAKMIPGTELFTTWTAAVWFVTRQQVRANSNIGEPEILPPGPSP